MKTKERLDVLTKMFINHENSLNMLAEMLESLQARIVELEKAIYPAPLPEHVYQLIDKVLKDG